MSDLTRSKIFDGATIYVNGFTDPSADDIKQLVLENGGRYTVFYSRTKVSHVIASNLCAAKIKDLGSVAINAIIYVELNVMQVTTSRVGIMDH